MVCSNCHSYFCYLCGKSPARKTSSDGRVLDHTNPYSHYSLDNPFASKSCKGKLFLGGEDGEEPVVPEDFRRMHFWPAGVEEDEGEFVDGPRELDLDRVVMEL
jgi:hypothetical protein